MRLSRLLFGLFNGPAWMTFLALGFAAGGFALCSYHLFEMFQANFEYVTKYGAMAILDSGLVQFVELVFWGYLGLACYVVFKGCLDGLLARVNRVGAGRN